MHHAVDVHDHPGVAGLDALLGAHRALVLDAVRRHARPGIDVAALVHAGIEGLLDAAARFDDSCGGFGDFAAWWVRLRVARRASVL